MKTLLSLFLVVAFTLTVSAQAVIVVQNATETRTFQTLNAAVEAAVDGDNIYVPGGSFVVSSLQINKRLNIIGAGHVPDSTTATGRTLVHGNIHFVDGSDYSTIQGIFFTNTIYMGYNNDKGNVSNILISRCNMEQINYSNHYSNVDLGANNIHVKDCIVRSYMNCMNTQNQLVENCIIGGQIANINGGFTFNNCMFLYSSGSYNLYVVNAAIINNCIFATTPRGSLTYTNLISPSSFHNCIFTFPPTQDDGNTKAYFSNCIGDVTNILGLFVHVPENKFDYNYDFHLTENSIAKSAGIEGTDCGIYGGANPYKEGAVPMNPHIQAISIPSTTDGEGKLHISVKVKAQNN